VRKEFQAAGDLMATSREFPFCIEVKRREGWTWGNLSKGRRSPVWGWWRQCQKAAAEMGKVPLMFFRKSREPWTIMMPAETARWLTPWFRWDTLGSVDYGREMPALWRLEAFLASEPGTHLMLSFKVKRRRR